MMSAQTQEPKILILGTLSGGYAGADSTGQSRLEYPANAYILPVMSPVMFPPDFYIRSFEHGIDGIIIMYSGTDSPYKVEAAGTAKLVNRAYALMKERGIDIRRLRLAAICTVCVKPFLKEVNQMNDLLKGIGLVRDELASHASPAKVGQEQAHG
jgi:F420-non-reducing hydrogenase iron-sulfur subunit